MNDYKFGNFLCSLREKKGMTQAEVANILGVTPAAVSKWENGSSKPRVEVLFQLAKLLDVRAEELMEGQYLENNVLDSDAVKEINERYEYLRKVDSNNNAGVKFRRLFAAFIDWNLIGFTVILLSLLFVFIVNPQNLSPIMAVLLIILILMFPVCFVLRDFIFAGRSLGKRIFGLIVLDKSTGQPAKRWKLVVRNLFIPIMQIDAIVLLISGSSIGDRVAHTVVVPRKVTEMPPCDFADNVSEINLYKKPKKRSKLKVTLIVAGTIVLFFTFMFTVINIALSSRKDTPEYKVCYQYFVNSDTFKALNADESDIRMNSYSAYTYRVADGDIADKSVRIGFVAKMKSYQVVCHLENDVWKVCDECTEFK